MPENPTAAYAAIETTYAALSDENKAKYEELYSIFTFYAKSGGTGTSASSGFMLQQAEVTNLALHCGLVTPDFAMAVSSAEPSSPPAAAAIFRRSSRVRGHAVALYEKRPGRKAGLVFNRTTPTSRSGFYSDAAASVTTA